MLKHPSFVDSLLADLPIFKPLVDPDMLWAFNEFSGAELNDQRLTLRLQLLAQDFEQQPLASIPQACGSWANGKAAYRFFSNPKVSFSAILGAHSGRTIERLGCAAPSVILCPQDTTTLNYMAHPATQGLGPVGTKPGKSLGMLLHSTLALGAEGQFFGLLHAQCWARPNRKKSRRARRRHQKDISEKESARWLESWRQIDQMAHLYPHHHWVSVADREADIYELFKEAAGPGHCADLLARARNDRPLLDHPGQTLFKHMRQLPSAGTYVVRVPRHDTQPAREATLSISFDKVSFAAPKNLKRQPPIILWAVWAREIDPPAGQEPICWCLLTTAPVRTLAQAIERIQWYVKRWMIEEFHRVLKSGCKAEARQLCTRERLQRSLALDMVVAWRIMDINKAARLQPDSPADQWFSTEEWQALSCYVNKTSVAPKEPPTISQMVCWIARLGGFLGRKSDGHPGATTLGRGLHRLNDIVAAWRAFGLDQLSHTTKSRRKIPRKDVGNA